MKAIEVNGEIKTFSSVPKTWTDDNGTHFNIGDGADFGFKDVVIPTHDSSVEELVNLHLEGDVYTYDVADKTFSQTLAELKAQKIANLKHTFNRELDSLQWYWDRAERTGGTKPVPQEIKDQDASLRTQCDDIEAQINALTTKKAVVSFALPNFI
jgi:hypothetical protein